jgi:hypothetical protein
MIQDSVDSVVDKLTLIDLMGNENFLFNVVKHDSEVNKIASK